MKMIVKLAFILFPSPFLSVLIVFYSQEKYLFFTFMKTPH